MKKHTINSANHQTVISVKEVAAPTPNTARKAFASEEALQNELFALYQDAMQGRGMTHNEVIRFTMDAMEYLNKKPDQRQEA